MRLDPQPAKHTEAGSELTSPGHGPPAEVGHLGQTNTVIDELIEHFGNTQIADESKDEEIWASIHKEFMGTKDGEPAGYDVNNRPEAGACSGGFGETSNTLTDEEIEWILAHEGPFPSSELSQPIVPSTPNKRPPRLHVQSRPTMLPLPEGIYEVAHSQVHQEYFDKHRVHWAVQWEIARLVTSYEGFTWDQVPVADISGMCGPVMQVAPIVGEILLSGNTTFIEYAKKEYRLRHSALKSPWADYEAEEPFIRGGNRASSIEAPGGTVQQRIRLTISGSGGDLAFKFTLDPPVKSKSNRFSRFLGSRRLIECYFSKKDANDYKEAIIRFFVNKKLLINGRLFQAFYGHDRKVELMEINEDYGREPQAIDGDYNRISLLDMIRWHNDPELNANQNIHKWASRFALGFSTSRPGLAFRPHNMHFIDDIYAPGKDQESAAAHQIMTDGCGFMNYAALLMVQVNMAWETFPTCIQARIAGAKGLFLLHPEHRHPSEEPQIWMRKSQVKVQLNPDKKLWSPTHYILDVLMGASVSSASSISYEMIMSLSENGVPDDVIVSLLRDTIREEANRLQPTSKPHGSHILWDSVYSAQAVLRSRLSSLISPEAHRAHGLSVRDDDDSSSSEEIDQTKWEPAPDPISGCPASMQEMILGWLQSGFASTDPFVMDKLVQLQAKTLKTAIERCRIVVPKSRRVLIVPDPLGVLNENEVFFASSQPIQFNDIGPPSYCLTGAVLVSRNPCIQISDTRKVMAKDNYELLSKGYYDVMIFSTQGDRSLASLLSGGDYDGDTVVMIWDPSIVNQFRNADTTYADPGPDFQLKNFDKLKGALRDPAYSSVNVLDPAPCLVEALLHNIVPNQLGIYNIMYRNAVYVHGLNNPATARLGHMFTQCLDSVKSGIEVKLEVFKRDKELWDREPPGCFPSKSQSDGSMGSSRKLGHRQIEKEFILDVFERVAVQDVKAYEARLGKMRDDTLEEYKKAPDQDLIRPFQEAEERARRHLQSGNEIQAIMAHVKIFRGRYNDAQGGRGEYSSQHLPKRKQRATPSIGERQENNRALAEEYARTMPSDLLLFDDTTVRRVAASYAYWLDFMGRSRHFRFCFTVAWSQLCAIKAQAVGGSFVTLTPGFIDAMAIHKKMAKVFREMEGEDTE